MAITPITDLSPSAAGAQTLGTAAKPWGRVYAPAATATADGLMAAADKKKLDGMFPASAQTFYLDVSGDDSITCPGSAAAPFKTLQGCVAAISSRQTYRNQGVTFRYNPGAHLAQWMYYNVPMLTSNVITIEATDAGNRPTITMNNLLQVEGSQAWTVRNVNLIGNVARAAYGAHLVLNNVSLLNANANTDFLQALYGGVLETAGTITLGGGGVAKRCLALADGGRAHLDSAFVLDNIPSVSWATVYAVNQSYLRGAYSTWTVDGAYTGKRYTADGVSVIATFGKGANAFPGTVDGTASSGGVYS